MIFIKYPYLMSLAILQSHVDKNLFRSIPHLDGAIFTTRCDPLTFKQKYKNQILLIIGHDKFSKSYLLLTIAGVSQRRRVDLLRSVSFGRTSLDDVAELLSLVLQMPYSAQMKRICGESKRKRPNDTDNQTIQFCRPTEDEVPYRTDPSMAAVRN